MKKEIGGYFEMGFNTKQPYHKKAIALNTARNCFEYVLLAKKVKKVFIPHYTCEVMLEPLIKHQIDYDYYSLDKNLDPLTSDLIKPDDFFLYTNYFGIKQNTIKTLTTQYTNLIVDNSMAFYSEPIENNDTFYSARKFFGVPDGAYLYSGKILKTNFEVDHSHNRMIHLFKRIEVGANHAYQNFLENDFTLYNQPIRRMSKITQLILSGIDYAKIKDIREKNFLFLRHFLKDFNELEIDISGLNGPMFYPFYIIQQN